MEQLYTGKQINELLGTKAEPWACKGKDLINRANSAGLEIEVAVSSPGKATLYKITKNNFYIEGEEWRINPFDTDYEASSLGRYRWVENKKLVNGRRGPDGYVRTHLRRGDGTYTSIAMHRIVFFAFHPELFDAKDEIVIDHINGMRDDNRIDNLRALTAASNITARDENREKLYDLLTQLVIKHGYESTLTLLKNLLKEEE